MRKKNNILERTLSEDSSEEEADTQGAGGDPQQSTVVDTWSITDDCVMIHHKWERTTLYVPDEATFPLPLEYIDVQCHIANAIHH